MLKDNSQRTGCKLCGSSKSKLLFSSDSYPDCSSGHVLKCLRCGLIFRSHYDQINTSCKFRVGKRSDFPDPLTERKKTMFADYLKYLFRYRVSNRILDVGFGEGYFLNLCSKEGWEVWGVDTNQELVDFTRKQYGITTFNGSLECAQYPENFFDVVTCLNIIEHVNDPYKLLKETFRVLRPGGALLLRSTNGSFHINVRRVFVKVYKIWHKSLLYNPSVIHRFLFNRVTIRSVLKKAGFDDISVQNSCSKWSREKRKGYPIQRSIGMMMENFAEMVRKLSFGRLLIATSLFVKAVKPLSYDKKHLAVRSFG